TTCRFLAVFLGEKARLVRFLHQWFCLNGSLNVLAARLDPGALPWHTRHVREFALAVSLGTQPAYYLIGWWLDQSDWRVFYQSGADTEPQERATGEFKPSGCYWPWGVAVGASAAPPDGTRLHLESGVIVNLPPAQSFQNAFSLFKELQAVVFAPSGPQPGVE